MSDSEKPNPPQNDPGANDNGNPKLPVRSLFSMLLVLAILVTMYQYFAQGQAQYHNLPYKPHFVKLLEQGKVRKVEVVIEGPLIQYLRGELDEIDPKTNKNKKFRVDVIITDRLEQELYDKVNEFSYKTANPYLREFLAGAIPIIIILGLLYFLFIRQMRMAGRGAMSFGKSRAKLLTRNKHKVTFDDVAGAEEAKEEVQEIVDFLQDPKKFQRLGGRIPTGVLLVGSPGTGKTLLAKAIAGEAEVPFFSISGSDFVEMFVGVGASRVRDMFEQGKKSAPCIIFIDEIDAVGRSRFSGIGGGHDEREQTLNALLVEMDGFDTQEGVIIVAATNRPDVLDPALMRPGRFDRQIMIDLPTVEGREAILKIHCKKIKLSPHVQLNRVARGTPGFSGADLANLVNEAALLAARRGADSVEMRDMEEARDKVAFGTERRSRMIEDDEKELVAYHEAGHAIVMECLDGTEPVHKVTIIPRGMALGATMQLPEKDYFTRARKKLIAEIVSFMGGRAAEELAFNEVTTGAANDLQRSTALVRAMITKFGMNDKLGLQTYGEQDDPVFLGRELVRHQQISEKSAELIDTEVKRILTECYQQAMGILTEHREQLDTMARVLLERETIDGFEVTEIVKFNRILTDEERVELHPEAVPKPDPEPEKAEAEGEVAAEVETPDEGASPLTPPKASPA